MPGPIRPEEVTERKAEDIPEVVYEAFNELIARGFSDGEATVYQDEVIDLIVAKDSSMSESQIFKNRLLDVEGAYRAAGWRVRYDKPGFNESGRAFFVFKKKR